ncbi:MAG: N-formylglutamate amidohydrolase [Candidatus Lokiarchaeota archaeon]
MDYITKYIEFSQGNVPIVISVSHGGELNPKRIPNRQSGVQGIDKKTNELAKDLLNEFSELSSKDYNSQIKPSYILSRIARIKVDFNRPLEKAFNQDSELAKRIYNYYHNKLKEFVEYNITNFGKSLLIDIHGFEKEMRPEGYRDVNLVLGTNNLKSLFDYEVRKKDWDKNVRGLIVDRFLKLGIPIAPGHARRKEYVLKGGYITRKYGSSNFKGSKAMQIEFSDTIRINNNSLKKTVLKNLVEILYRSFLC